MRGGQRPGRGYVWRVCYRVSHSFLADRCGSMVFAIEGFCRLIVADHCSHPPLPVVSMDRIGKYSTESSVWRVPGGRTVAGLPWLPPRCARTCASDTSTKVPNPQAHLLVMSLNNKQPYFWQKSQFKNLLYPCRLFTLKNILRVTTVELRFNLVPDLTYKCFRPCQSHSKMYGEEPRFNEPRFNVIPDITNKIWRTERKNYPDITKKMSSRHRRRIRQEMKPIIFCLFSKNIVSSYPLHAAKHTLINHECYKLCVHCAIPIRRGSVGQWSRTVNFNYYLYPDLTKILVIFPQIRYIGVLDLTKPRSNEPFFPVPCASLNRGSTIIIAFIYTRYKIYKLQHSWCSRV